MCQSGRAVAAVLVVVVLTGGPAAAHTELVASTPREGQTLATAPSTVRLEFSEDVKVAVMSLVAPDGAVSKATRVRIEARTVTGAVAPPDQLGRWTLAYRVVSADGHAISADITFFTSGGQAVAQKSPPQPDPGILHQHGNLVGALIVGLAAIGLIVTPALRRT